MPAVTDTAATAAGDTDPSNAAADTSVAAATALSEMRSWRISFSTVGAQCSRLAEKPAGWLIATTMAILADAHADKRDKSASEAHERLDPVLETAARRLHPAACTITTASKAMTAT
jgi:hypothetical protein